MDLPTAAMRGQPHRMPRTFAALLLLAISFTLPAWPLRAATAPEIWLAPHAGHPTAPGAADYATLFYASNSAWVAVAGKLQVYSVNVTHLRFAPDAELLRMASDLQSRHIALSISFNSIAREPGDSCGDGEGYETAAATQAFVTRLLRLKIRPASVNMDGPLWYGHYNPKYCRFPVPALIQRVATSLAIWTNGFPGLTYGETEGWVQIQDNPGWQHDYAQFRDGIAAATGVRVSFVHTDTNIHGHPNWPALLVTAQAFVHQMGMKYGMIYDGYGTEQSSVLWIADAKTLIATMESQMRVIPDMAVVASFDPYPTDILPPTSPATLSSLLYYYLTLPH